MQKNAKQIEEQLRIQRIARSEVRRMKSLLSEQAGSKVKEAFLDIFRALKLAAMDISNSLRLAIGLLFTFDPAEIEKKIEAFDARRQNINAEWAPILQRADEAFQNADPILTMAVIGPANFLALQGVGVGLEAGKTAIEILAAKKWETLVNSFSVSLDLNQSMQQFFQKYSRDEERRQQRDRAAIDALRTGRGRGVLNSLSGLFSEGVGNEGSLLTEQAAPPTPGKMFNEKQAIEIFVKATGMDKNFEKIRKANLENLTTTMNSIRADLEPLMSSAQLFAANDAEAFKKAFDSAKAKNPKISPVAFDKFMKTLETETAKLIKDPKFLEDLNKKSPGIASKPDQVKIEAQKTVFDITKKEFDKQLANGLSKAVTVSDKAIKALNIDDKVLKHLKDSPYKDANETAKVYEGLLTIYKGIKSDFESKAKTKATV